MTNEKLAFEQTYKNFGVKAYWGDEPDARIEVTRDNQPFKTFGYPAYKVFNIAAHFSDMIDSLLREEATGVINQ